MSDPPSRNPSAKARGRVKPELQSLLAALASGQTSSPTACAVRAGEGGGVVANGPAERMVRMFGRDKATSRAGDNGAFNGPVARKLAGKENE